MTATQLDRLLTSTEACERTNATYRQLDYLCRQGFAFHLHPGSGYRRGLTHAEVVAVMIAVAITNASGRGGNTGGVVRRLPEIRQAIASLSPADLRTISNGAPALVAVTHTAVRFIPPNEPFTPSNEFTMLVPLNTHRHTTSPKSTTESMTR